MPSDDHTPVNRTTHTISVGTTGFSPVGAQVRQGDTVQFTSTETVATMHIAFDSGLFSGTSPLVVGPLASISPTVLPSEGDFEIHATKKEEPRDPMTGSIKVGGGTEP